MSKRFEGRVAAVTGGGSGIGAAICRRLAEEGAIVAALDLSEDRAQQVIGDLPGAVAVRADVSDSASVEEALSKVETDLGPLAIMVNNAGRAGDVPRGAGQAADREATGRASAKMG